MNSKPSRRKQTKIVATISDRKCDIPFIQGLVYRGVDVFRINTAHQTPDITAKVVENIRAVSKLAGILIDTKGPEVRTRDIEESVVVEVGEEVSFSGQILEGKNIPVSYENFVRDVPEGARILIDDGEVGFTVERKEADRLICVAGNAGVVKNRKSVNVPGVHLDLPALTDKDREYVRYARDNDVDFIAHSFVRNRADIREIREILGEAQDSVKIIAKIENREGVDNAGEILKDAHGIMVARGDLGIEIPAEEVPAIQKSLIRLCVSRAKTVITATQMLHSMIDNPRPTRAEVSDVANAVLDGTDALMLSGESAYGNYPFEAVETMTRVALATEASRQDNLGYKSKDETPSVRSFLARSAIEASHAIPVRALIVHTYSGKTARVVSSYRGRIPVYVKCHDINVARELTLSYGLYPTLIDLPDSTDKLISTALSSLVERKLLDKADMVVILAGSPPHRSNQSNLIEINTVQNCLAGRKSE
ncbi:MAG: pyruvate kinase [Spirochaetales bacterium]|nr:pyruvate kinase [Spirochaetales bacterium]